MFDAEGLRKYCATELRKDYYGYGKVYYDNETKSIHMICPYTDDIQDYVK